MLKGCRCTLETEWHNSELERVVSQGLILWDLPVATVEIQRGNEFGLTQDENKKVGISRSGPLQLMRF